MSLETLFLPSDKYDLTKNQQIYYQGVPRRKIKIEKRLYLIPVYLTYEEIVVHIGVRASFLLYKGKKTR